MRRGPGERRRRGEAGDGAAAGEARALELFDLQTQDTVRWENVQAFGFAEAGAALVVKKRKARFGRRARRNGPRRSVPLFRGGGTHGLRGRVGLRRERRAAGLHPGHAGRGVQRYPPSGPELPGPGGSWMRSGSDVRPPHLGGREGRTLGRCPGRPEGGRGREAGGTGERPPPLAGSVGIHGAGGTGSPAGQRTAPTRGSQILFPERLGPERRRSPEWAHDASRIFVATRPQLPAPKTVCKPEKEESGGRGRTRGGEAADSTDTKADSANSQGAQDRQPGLPLRPRRPAPGPGRSHGRRLPGVHGRRGYLAYRR